MSGINLNFINRSEDQNNSDVVIFQKNVLASASELPVAWTVIQNCGPGWHHPFVVSDDMMVGASDSWGNYSPPMSAQPGQQYSVAASASGDVLQYTGNAASPLEIAILNALTVGAIGANIYQSGKLLATQTGIAPGQKAVFQFEPTIWIGAVSQITQGDVMNSAIVSQLNTQISLFGLSSADIVMTGGGSGPDAQPFIFILENVQSA